MSPTEPERDVLSKPDHHFDDPLEIVESDEFAYEDRLNMLQTWLARISEDRARIGERPELEGAILALQSRSKLGMDEPGGKPASANYGTVRRSDLKRHGTLSLLQRMRGLFRK